MAVHLTVAGCFSTSTSISLLFSGHTAGVIPLAYLLGDIMPCLNSPSTSPCNQITINVSFFLQMLIRVLELLITLAWSAVLFALPSLLL